MSQDRPFISAITRTESIKIYLDEILFIERRRRKILIATDEYDIEYYDKMNNIVPALEENFVPVIEGCYVNLDKIKGVKKYQIIFDSGREIPVSTRSYPKIKRCHFARNRLEQMKKVYEKNTCL